MALSMDEQRILAQIEQHLARSEPALAARLAAFGHPRAQSALRSPRTRLLAAIVLMIVIATASLVVYSLMALRGTQDRGGNSRPASSPGQPVMTMPGKPSPIGQSAPAGAVSRASPAAPAP